MFRELLSCKQFCPEVEHQSEVVFSISKDRSELSLHKEYRSLEGVEWDQHMSYMRIQKSRYSDILKELQTNRKSFKDPEFPASARSLGTAPSRSKNVVWKRIGDIIARPVFFDESIDSPDSPIGNNNDCYLLPTITALFQRGVEYLQRIFGTMQISPQGIYMMRVNFMGVPQEIVVDDYFPVYEDTMKLVFAKPRQGNEIWEMIVEKVWAKLKGSYSNIQSGLPHEVMTTFSHAPCFFLDVNIEDQQFSWLHLQEAARSGFPTVVSSKRNVPLNCGIRPLQTYIVLGSYELQAYGQVIGQVIKLICPNDTEVFDGEYSPNNRQFWSQITPTSKDKMGYSYPFNELYFFISLRELLQYFDSIDICHLQTAYNYNFQKGSSPTGSLYFEVDVEEEGEAYFTLHQKLLKSASSNMAIYGRMIILIAKVVNEDYQYVASKMEMNFPNVSVRCPFLGKGRYIVYTKCYRKAENGEYGSVLAVYSRSRASIKRKSKELCQSFFQRVFLSHAYSNPQKTYLNAARTDWICTKLLFNEGGFGYIAAYVDPPSSKKIRIEFDSRQPYHQIRKFDESGFQIKEPYNHVGVGKMVAEAGRPCILVCRLHHHVPSNIVFPPKLNIDQSI